MTTKKPSGAVRLWGWRSVNGNVWMQLEASYAKYAAKLAGGTYLGEYIARPVKKPAKKKGARR
jgi:hypothetical protein